MQQRTKWLSITTLGLAAVLASGSAAMADPINPDTGAPTLNRALNGSGSDTTQDLNNGLSAVVERNGQLILGSWDATVPAGDDNFIQTHTGGTSIPRPNGSGQGVSALKATVTGSVLSNARGTSNAPLSRSDLQFARSSSGVPASTSGAYSYVPLAVDAVTYAFGPASSLPEQLELSELTAIYRAAEGASVVIDGTPYVVGSGASAAIHPYLPQSGSGTRAFFLAQLGLTETTKGSAVKDVFSGGSVQEHDGSVLAADPKGLVPFSVAQWIAQGNADDLTSSYGVEVLDRRKGAELGTVGAQAPVVDGVLNTAFQITRPVFTVVENAAIGTNTDLAFAFVDNPATAATEGAVYTAESPSGESWVIEDFGFGSLINRDSEVNGVTIAGETYRAGDAVNFRTN
ncbi:substrate-binding domain-containing protein [Cellulomonas sp. C5510]|uniref:substrate-binding domain-containing protein n=1 Tax=Cellulomonas sp. C5510 TaxID=2871170 RepID=UPI001C9608E4|nr:substrate-binding domain-containing protein [Cellulomonas sp. C5510]QZN86847.1 substrate-binding domain-containing protein [Cellulomonas sp. C5510]